MINIKGMNSIFRSLDGRYIINIIRPECLLMSTTLLKIDGINLYIKIEDLVQSKTYIGVLTVKENNYALTMDISHWFLFGFKIENIDGYVKIIFNKIDLSVDLEILESDYVSIINESGYSNIVKEDD